MANSSGIMYAVAGSVTVPSDESATNCNNAVLDAGTYTIEILVDVKDNPEDFGFYLSGYDSVVFQDRPSIGVFTINSNGTEIILNCVNKTPYPVYVEKSLLLITTVTNAN